MNDTTQQIGYERLLVPVGDKSDPNNLTELSSLLVDPRHGAVQFVHVTTDRSFVGSQEDWRTGSESVAQSQHQLRQQGIESTGSIRTARNAVNGILEEADEYDADAILIGWTDTDSVSRMVAQLLRKADCDVLVFRAEEEPTAAESLLVPVVTPPNEHRLRMSAILSHRAEASVTFAYVVGSDNTEEDGWEILEQSMTELEAFGVQADPELVHNDDVIDALGQLSADYDVMVIGTSRGWWLRQSLFGRKTDKIAETAQCSVLMHKWQGEVPPESE